mgnify:CR=1 FL=1
MLASLSDAQKQAALNIAVEKSVPKGTTLMHQGDDGDTLLVIREGTCKICIYTASGKELILDYLGPGQIAGELSVFDGQPCSASVITVESCRVAVFQRAALLSFLEKNPDITLQIIKVLCARIRRTNQLLESDRSYAMGPKLARGLLQLVAFHGANIDSALNAESSLRFAISQSDLGNFVSLSRENVNRQLRDWQETGILTAAGGKITIKDLQALRDIADYID